MVYSISLVQQNCRSGIVIKISPSPEESDRLFENSFSASTIQGRKRCMVVHLRNCGMSNRDIAAICRVTPATVANCLKSYQSGGIKNLTLNNHKGHPSLLNQHSQEMKEVFAENPPASVKEARQMIAQHTGITLSIPQIWYFMKRIGLSCRKAGGIPDKASAEEQEEL